MPTTFLNSLHASGTSLSTTHVLRIPSHFVDEENWGIEKHKSLVQGYTARSPGFKNRAKT